MAFILDLAGFTADVSIEDSTLLDPACGCGVFLAQATSRLADRVTDLGVDLSSQAGAASFAEIVERNLFGIDKDAQACSLALEVVRHEVLDRTGGHDLPSGFFEKNIDCRDYLEDQAFGLFSKTPRKPFNFIVGNPPYVTTSRLSESTKREYRTRFRSAHGRIDLYLLFFERSLEILEQDGILAFITPDKFLTSESAARLRQLIRSACAVQNVARFDSHRVFPEAALVPCITILARRHQQDKVKMMLCRQKEKPRGTRIVKSWQAQLPEKMQDAWFLLQREVDRVLNRLRNANPTLGQVTDRISAGVATGRDSIFAVGGNDSQNLEPELLNKVVRGRDIRRLEIEDSRLHLIVPFVTEANGEVRLADLKAFPLVREYLRAHKKELEARHCVRKWSKAWYDIHDPWTFNLTKMPKVVFPDLARSNRFAFDDGRLCPLHSAYYMTSSSMDLEYLAAILNSKPVEFFAHVVSPIAKDSFRRYRRQFLVGLPIPALSSADRLKVIRAAQETDFDELNSLASWAYKLSPSQKSTVDKYLGAAARSRLPGGS